MKKLLAIIGGLVLLSPLGLLAVGEAWGEWSPEDLGRALGFVPQGMERLSEVWRWAPMPDYSVPGLPEPLGYIASGVVGAALAAGVIWLIVSPKKS